MRKKEESGWDSGDSGSNPALTSTGIVSTCHVALPTHRTSGSLDPLACEMG